MFQITPLSSCHSRFLTNSRISQLPIISIIVLQIYYTNSAPYMGRSFLFALLNSGRDTKRSDACQIGNSALTSLLRHCFRPKDQRTYTYVPMDASSAEPVCHFGPRTGLAALEGHRTRSAAEDRVKGGRKARWRGR